MHNRNDRDNDFPRREQRQGSDYEREGRFDGQGAQTRFSGRRDAGDYGGEMSSRHEFDRGEGARGGESERRYGQEGFRGQGEPQWSGRGQGEQQWSGRGQGEPQWSGRDQGEQQWAGRDQGEQQWGRRDQGEQQWGRPVPEGSYRGLGYANRSHENTFGGQGGLRGYENQLSSHGGQRGLAGGYGGSDRGYEGNQGQGYEGGYGGRDYGQMGGARGNQPGSYNGSSARAFAPQYGGQSARGRGPRGYKRSDERIHEDLCDRLMQQDHIDAEDIEVKVKDGEVTLSGTVESRQIKHMVENLADSISGVQEIHNLLRLRRAGQEGSAYSQRSSEKSSEKRSQQDLSSPSSQPTGQLSGKSGLEGQKSQPLANESKNDVQKNQVGRASS